MNFEVAPRRHWPAIKGGDWPHKFMITISCGRRNSSYRIWRAIGPLEFVSGTASRVRTARRRRMSAKADAEIAVASAGAVGEAEEGRKRALRAPAAL